jgi:hypothetical protein
MNTTQCIISILNISNHHTNIQAIVLTIIAVVGLIIATGEEVGLEAQTTGTVVAIGGLTETAEDQEKEVIAIVGARVKAEGDHTQEGLE